MNIMRPCFIVYLTITIVIPRNAHSFFNVPVLDIIEPTGQLRCHVNATESPYDDFQLCAIRVYIPHSDMNEVENVTVQNGMWFTNVFHRLIATRNCVGFSETSDIGSATCNVMLYENAARMTLCICAMNNCNLNLETCEAANQEVSNVNQLPKSLPILNKTIECNQTSEAAEACYEHSLINYESCHEYTSNHNVLCTIGLNGDTLIQEGLLEETYEIFLDKKLYALKPIVQSNPTNPLIETQDYVYYMYYPDTTIPHQDCACTQSSYCNMNISLCAPRSIQMETTISDEITSEYTDKTAFISTTIQSSRSIVLIEQYTTETVSTIDSVQETNSPIEDSTKSSIISDITESGTNMVTNFIETTIPYTAEPKTIVISSIMGIPISSTESTVNDTNPVEYSTISSNATIHSRTFDSSTVIPSLNSGMIIGIIVGAVIFLVLFFSILCCQCVRLDLCHCPCGDRTANYKI
ncbi:hypothetical protein I4U23_028907 [Adineta vaga]|nr:hypothetical protein I4U23_028907 [Adineta vaga]